MTRPALPDAVRRFLLTSIPSVPFLEAVLLLRAEPQRDWDAAAVARRLYLPEAHAAELLAGLQGAGIAQAGAGGARYAPATDELRGTLDQLAAYYAADLVGVTDLIHARTDRKARQFADAFRWRKDD